MALATASTNRPIQPTIVNACDDFRRDYELGLSLSEMTDNAWRRPRFFHLLQIFRSTAGVPGATAEAGVFRGLASRILCLERRREDPDFDGEGHFGVDSFEGLSPPATIDDDPSCAGRFADTSVEMARRTLEGFPAVELVKGWIPEALDQLPDQQYRFVHVDVDLHDPTLASLEYFFPRMVRGGVIVIDDYGPWPNGEFPGCKIAADEFVMRHGIGLAALDTGNAVIFKR